MFLSVNVVALDVNLQILNQKERVKTRTEHNPL